MTLLARVSVRSILNAVFVLFAVTLSAVLLFQLTAAWQAVATAARLSALSTADRSVFQGMTTLRQQRANVQTAIMGFDDPSRANAELHSKVVTLFNDAVAAARTVNLAGTERVLADLDARWRQIEGYWPDIEAVGRKPKAERDLKATLPWYNGIGELVDTLGRVSLGVANEMRMADSAIGELVSIRQAVWMIRVNSGNECVVTRQPIGQAKPLPSIFA
jgi:methyl-accepting chemotaxis protein